MPFVDANHDTDNWYARDKAWNGNNKRAYRIYCALELNLRIRPKKWPKRPKPDMLTAPDGPNQIWSMDFMADQLAVGRPFRDLNVLDDFNRKGWGLRSTSR